MASANGGKPSRFRKASSCHSGNCGQARHGQVDGLADLIQTQSLGQGIDRFNQGQLVEFALGNHAVGMHYLQHAVIEGGRAGDDAGFADRQDLVDEVLAGGEIGEHQVAGVVARIDQIRRARAARRRRAMTVHMDSDGRNLSGHDLGELWPGAPVDGPGRQMEQEIEQPGAVLAAEQAAIELVQLGADAGKGRDFGEQGIEGSGPHCGHKSGGLGPAVARLAPPRRSSYTAPRSAVHPGIAAP